MFHVLQESISVLTMLWEWVECETSLILNCLLQVGQKVESSGLDFKKLDKLKNQKTCWQDLMISGFLSDFHICHRQRGKGEDLYQEQNLLWLSF